MEIRVYKFIEWLTWEGKTTDEIVRECMEEFNFTEAKAKNQMDVWEDLKEWKINGTDC